MKNLLTGTIVLALLVGCQSGPTVEDVQVENDRQQRVLQQTISQLRKGLDEVRSQRDEVQTKYHEASTELDTTQRNLQVTTARMRAERERAEASTKEVTSLSKDLEKTKRTLKTTKERSGKLERELTSLRVAFETDQGLVEKLNKNEVKLQREIDALKEKFTRHETSWNAERRGFQEKLQERDDEIAVLEERISDGEGALAAAAKKTPKKNTTSSNTVASGGDSEVPRGRREYFETPPPRPTVNRAETTAKPVAGGNGVPTTPNATSDRTASRSDEAVVVAKNPTPTSGANTPTTASDATEPEGFVGQVKEAFAFAVGQFQHFFENPGQNYNSLLHPIPIGVVVIVLLVPVMMIRFARRGRRRAKKAAKASGRVSVQSTRVASPQIRSVANARPATVRVDDSSQIADSSFENSDDPLSPSNVGNIAATLDKVLGGDPIAEGDPAVPGAPPAKKEGEDELLGDLKDIVSKGLS